MVFKKNIKIDPGFIVAATNGRDDLITVLALRGRDYINSISGSWPAVDDAIARQSEIESAQLDALLDMLDRAYRSDDERPPEATRRSMAQVALNIIGTQP